MLFSDVFPANAWFYLPDDLEALAYRFYVHESVRSLVVFISSWFTGLEGPRRRWE